MNEVINVEIIHMEVVDSEDMNQRLVAAELKLWRKIEEIAYEQGKHPDEVYVEMMLKFVDFIEGKGTESKPAEKKTKELKKRCPK